jgi:hypothetical protein
MTGPNVLGVDVEALENFARVLNDSAAAFEERSGQLTNLLGSVQWSGNYANNFRTNWESSARPNLQSIATMLREAATQAFNHAQQQRAISGN